MTNPIHHQNQSEYYQVTVKKGFLGRVTVTVKDPSSLSNAPTPEEERIGSAVKRAMGPLLSRGSTTTYFVVCDDKTSFHIEDRQKHTLAQITTRSSPPQAESIDLALLLDNHHFCTQSPISAVDAFCLSLPNRKQTLTQVKKDLSHLVRNSPKVEPESLRKELLEAHQKHEHYFQGEFSAIFSDFFYAPSLFSKKQPGLQRLQKLLNSNKPLTREEEKLIRQAYAHYIKKSGLHLGNCFFHLVIIAYPQSSIFINSGEEIQRFSANPEKATGFHSAFLYQRAGTSGYHCYVRTDALNTQQPLFIPAKRLIRTPTEVLLERRTKERTPVSIWTALKTEFKVPEDQFIKIQETVIDYIQTHQDPEHTRTLQQDFNDAYFIDPDRLERTMNGFCTEHRVQFENLIALCQKHFPSEREKKLIRSAYAYYAKNDGFHLGSRLISALKFALPDNPIVIQRSDGHVEHYSGDEEQFPAEKALFIREEASGLGCYTFDLDPTNTLPDLRNPALYLRATH